MGHHFLTLPAPGDRTLARLLRKVRLLGARTLLTHPLRGLSGPVVAAVPPLRRALAGALRTDPEPTLRALGSPDVLPLVGCLVRDSANADDCLRRLVPSLALALHRAGVQTEPWLWDVPFADATDPQRGRLHLEAPAQGLAMGTDLEIRTADGALRGPDELAAEPFRHPIPSLDTHLALWDANPLASLEEHPDKDGNAVDLGGRDPEEWCRRLGDAAEVVQSMLPALGAEIRDHLHRIVPVGYGATAHLSASYLEAPGTVYMTLHPSTLTLAEALIHETQHGKLNALRWLDPVLTNPTSETVVSPVRPDPRPLIGVLLAVHAFVPVAALHQRLAESDHPLARDPAFAARRAEVLAGNGDGIRTLHLRGRWTPQGVRLFDGLCAAQDEAVLAADPDSLSPDPLPEPDTLEPAR